MNLIDFQTASVKVKELVREAKSKDSLNSLKRCLDDFNGFIKDKKKLKDFYIEVDLLHSRLSQLNDFRENINSEDREIRQLKINKAILLLTHAIEEEVIEDSSEVDRNIKENVKIEFRLDKKFTEFSKEEQGSFISKLENALKLDPDEIKFIRKRPGSVKITLELPGRKLRQVKALERLGLLSQDKLKEIKVIGSKNWEDYANSYFDVFGSDLSDVDLSGRDLNGIDLSGIYLKRVILKGVNLQNATLQGSNLIEVDLENAILDNSNLRDVNLTDSNLAGCSLKNVDLSNSNLSRANLQQSDLKNSYLHRTNFLDSNLKYSDLSDTYLIGANLTDAALEGANLSKAIFSKTILGSLDLRRVKGLDSIEHHGPSIIDGNTFAKSFGSLPTEFLRGCGLPDWQIETVKLYNPNLNTSEITDIVYRIDETRNSSPIQLHNLFISYSHRDNEFVNLLENILDKNNIRYWRDIHEATSGPLDKIIVKSIHQNPIFLIVLSKNSIESDWVQWEILKARELEKELGRPVICPIAIDNEWKQNKLPNRIEEAILKYNILDFSGWNNEEELKQISNKLIKGLDLFYKRT